MSIVVYVESSVIENGIRSIVEDGLNIKIWVAETSNRMHIMLIRKKPKLLLVTDYAFPLTMVGSLKKHFPLMCVVVILSDFHHVHALKEFNKFGIDYCFNLKSSQSEIGRVLNQLLESGSVLDSKGKFAVAKSNRLSGKRLSQRELSVASLLVKGMSNATIGEVLSLASSSVSTYKKRILMKTNTRNVLELSNLNFTISADL